MDIQGFIVRERARGDSFRFLSACFYQPGKDQFLGEGLLGNLAQALKHASQEAAAAAVALEKAFMKYSERDLMVSYAKLFIGPDKLIAPPYGSVYLDKERRVMGDSTIEVIEFYREAGLSMDEGFREVPDHITAELEFMYYLAFKEVEALEQSQYGAALDLISIQESFVSRFLGRWIRPFCERMREGTDNGFYRALAGCVSAFAGDMLPEDVPLASGNFSAVKG